MAPLTWRNINDADFTKAAQILQMASNGLSSGFGGLGDAFRAGAAVRQESQSNAAMGKLAKVSGSAGVDPALDSILGSVNPADMSPELVSAMMGIRGAAQGYDKAGGTGSSGSRSGGSRSGSGGSGPGGGMSIAQLDALEEAAAAAAGGGGAPIPVAATSQGNPVNTAPAVQGQVPQETQPAPNLAAAMLTTAAQGVAPAQTQAPVEANGFSFSGSGTGPIQAGAVPEDPGFSFNNGAVQTAAAPQAPTLVDSLIAREAARVAEAPQSAPEQVPTQASTPAPVPAAAAQGQISLPLVPGSNQMTIPGSSQDQAPEPRLERPVPDVSSVPAPPPEVKLPDVIDAVRSGDAVLGDVLAQSYQFSNQPLPTVVNSTEAFRQAIASGAKVDVEDVLKQSGYDIDRTLDIRKQAMDEAESSLNNIETAVKIQGMTFDQELAYRNEMESQANKARSEWARDAAEVLTNNPAISGYYELNQMLNSMDMTAPQRSALRDAIKDIQDADPERFAVNPRYVPDEGVQDASRKLSTTREYLLKTNPGLAQFLGSVNPTEMDGMPAAVQVESWNRGNPNANLQVLQEIAAKEGVNIDMLARAVYDNSLFTEPKNGFLGIGGDGSTIDVAGVNRIVDSLKPENFEAHEDLANKFREVDRQMEIYNRDAEYLNNWRGRLEGRTDPEAKETVAWLDQQIEANRTAAQELSDASRELFLPKSTVPVDDGGGLIESVSQWGGRAAEAVIPDRGVAAWERAANDPEIRAQESIPSPKGVVVDQDASPAAQALQRAAREHELVKGMSSIAYELNQRGASPGAKLFGTIGDQFRKTADIPARKAAREAADQALDWFETPEARNLLTTNMALLEEAQEDPVAFFQKYGKSGK